jgi:hypothetical protein
LSGARAFWLAAAAATALGAWLRIHGITGQVVIDDEWHAIHKLIASDYAEIFSSFGMADHSIPLTAFYKAMAGTLGLAEGRLRFLQIACGIVLIPLAAWLAWRATDDAPAAALFAFLVSAAPFLVLWSRFARPYAIALLFTAVCIAAVWRWRARRSRRLAAAAAAAAALAAWFHPLMGVYAALACTVVFLEDALTASTARPRPSMQSLALGIGVAAAMALPLAAPLESDAESLAGKAGGDLPSLETFERMLAIFWGGLPTFAMMAATAVAIWGAVLLWRRDRPLAFYLVLLGIVPVALVTLLGAVWAHQGQNLARYVLPFLPITLFFGSVGAVDLARRGFPARAQAAAWTASLMLAIGYLAGTPTIAYVATLGPWFAHLDYHWDYRYRWNFAKRHDPRFEPPAFYRKLAAMAPGSAPIIEAPFIWEAPENDFAYYATFHRQPETMGLLHDLCRGGPRIGETPPRDRRFRFRKFVHLGDADAVRATGARYLLLHRKPSNRLPFPEHDRCLARLEALYGPPLERDGRLAVFDLQPGKPPPTLQ